MSNREDLDDLRRSISAGFSPYKIPDEYFTQELLELWQKAKTNVQAHLRGENKLAGPVSMVELYSYLLDTLPKDLPQRPGWISRRATWVARVAEGRYELLTASERGHSYKEKADPDYPIPRQYPPHPMRLVEGGKRAEHAVHVPPKARLCTAPSRRHRADPTVHDGGDQKATGEGGS